MKAFMTLGFRSRQVMEWAFRVMSNLMPPGDHDLNHQVYNAIEGVVNAAPAGLGASH